MFIAPCLDALSADVKSGHNLQTPVHFGLVTIRRSELRNGVVCLWTDLDPGGYSGFVRTTDEEVGHQFNLWHSMRLRSNWQYIEED